MSIVSSTHVVGPAQRDGRVYVTETHTDNVGLFYIITYLIAAGADYVAIRTARAAVLATQIADDEYDARVAVDGWSPLEYQTASQFAARLRAAYRVASDLECARLATWIMNRIDAGEFTETQVQNAFGLTLAQWTTLKAKLIALRSNYNAVQAAQGE
jgi:hypothetical protein